jgi:hypothetical protein
MPAMLRIAEGTPVTAVFQALATRSDLEFYDDVLLVDARDGYVGMIQVDMRVRLQTQFLMGSIARLEVSCQEIAAKARQMEDDLQMASKVEQAMMPREEAPSPEPAPMLRIAHHFHPAGVVSGDFFDVLRMPDGSVGILVCDVMGHGVRSALIAAMIRAMLEQLRPVAHDSGAFLSRLNRDLTRILRQTGDMIFATAAYCVFDPGRGVRRSAGADGKPKNRAAKSRLPLSRGRQPHRQIPDRLQQMGLAVAATSWRITFRTRQPEAGRLPGGAPRCVRYHMVDLPASWTALV